MTSTCAPCGPAIAAALFGILCGSMACSAPPPVPASPPETAAESGEVVVMGTIHDGHRTSALYGTKRLEAILRPVRPNVVLAEIPPDRLDASNLAQ